MTTPALAATRAVAVLNYFTANPRRAFTLSELCSALGVSLASLSAVLKALTDAGYLVRHPRHKTYEIGLALVAAGNAASTRHPVVELARPEMQRLAQETGHECVGSAVVGDDIVILALEGRPSAQSHELWLGQRLPLLPPMGQAFLAWGLPAQVSSWLSALRPDAREQLQGALDVVRRRGYSVHPSTDELTALSDALAQLSERPADGTLRQQTAKLVSALDVADYELLEIDRKRRYRIRLMVAPVFGTDGSVIFSITLYGDKEYTGRDIIRVGEQLAAAGRVLTREIGGRLPNLALGEDS
jgi:DNA-binding IclR family transcriptional regulator